MAWVVVDANQPLHRPIPEPLLEPLARRLQVLGQPLRIRLVDRLDLDEELSVGEIATRLGITSYNASQQLGVLRQEGIVSRRQHGREGIHLLVDARAMLIYEIAAASLADERRSFGRRLGPSA